MGRNSSQGYADALMEAACRKACFDDKVHPVDFQSGDLVQIYNLKLDTTHETKAKLLPRWSPPLIVTDCLLNSYILCRLDGTELRGTTHARWLHRYIPRHDGLVNQRYPTDTPTPEMPQWDEVEEEDNNETLPEIHGLFWNEDTMRACVA